MTKKEFLKSCADVFCSNGFEFKGTTFYRENKHGIMAVFGFMKSTYGPYYYLEYGFAIKAINRFLPYPKFNELEINCGRVNTPIGKAFHYEQMTNDDITAVLNTVYQKIQVVTLALEMSEKEFLHNFILADPSPVSYLTKDTAEYFKCSSLLKEQGIRIVCFDM